ncbi:hypothetical protein EDC94DRAFT_644929 [Helicostylum pulchrum]|nr:hypothetical protein EDC94DRAFT_644929 [Helicostylum pulchrum]
MNILQNRIDSFNNNLVKWPHNNDNFPKIECFAEAGFYFVRRPKAPDTVCCFLCNIEISHWRPSQSPLIRHGFESPQCAWKRLNFPDVPSSVSRRIKSVCLPRSAEMRNARLATFNSHRYWPPKKGSFDYPSSIKLANAGFFFAPTIIRPSQVKCTHCGLTLVVNSSDEDMMNTHRDMSKDCLFFQKIYNTRERKNSVNKPVQINDNNSHNDVVGSKRRIRKIPLSSSQSNSCVSTNKRQKENHNASSSVQNKVSTSVGTRYGAKNYATYQTAVLPVNDILHRPMITYGSSRYSHRLLAKQNILPDLNTLVRDKPTKAPTLEQGASGSGEGRKFIQPVTRRVLEGRAKKSSRKSTAADTESSTSRKRKLPRAFTSDTVKPCKRLRLKVVVDHMNKDRSPSPRPVFKNKSKGKAVTFALIPQTIPLPPSIPSPQYIPLPQIDNDLLNTSTSSQASCSYTPVPLTRTARGLSSSTESQEEEDLCPLMLPAMDFSIPSTESITGKNIPSTSIPFLR